MIEHHPYGCFIHAHSMIIGSFPIGKFSDPDRRHEIRPHEIDFFFGGEKNLLWKLLGQCYGRPTQTRAEVVALLEEKGIAMGDVIKSCRRHRGRASDSDLYDIEWHHELLGLIHEHHIKRLFFTSKQVHRWFRRLFPEREGLEEIVLISPSAQSARGVVQMKEFLEWKRAHPAHRPQDFILAFYRKIFS